MDESPPSDKILGAGQGTFVIRERLYSAHAGHSRTLPLSPRERELVVEDCT